MCAAWAGGESERRKNEREREGLSCDKGFCSRSERDSVREKECVCERERVCVCERERECV